MIGSPGQTLYLMSAVSSTITVLPERLLSALFQMMNQKQFEQEGRSISNVVGCLRSIVNSTHTNYRMTVENLLAYRTLSIENSAAVH